MRLRALVATADLVLSTMEAALPLDALLGALRDG